MNDLCRLGTGKDKSLPRFLPVSEKQPRNFETEETMNTTTQLSKGQFKDFYTFLTIIKQHCQDFPVVQGQFRSRDNSNHCIIETHLDFFNQMDFIIADIKFLAKMLSTLDKKQNIVVDVNDESVVFSDGAQSVHLKKCNEEFCGNKFVPMTEMDEIWGNEIDEDKPLVKELLAESVVSRINKVSHDFGVQVLRIKHEEGDPRKGYFLIKDEGSSQSEERRKYVIGLKKEFLMPIKEGGNFVFSTLPYNFNKSDVLLKINFYRDSEILGIMHKAKIGNLSIAIYSRCQLLPYNG
jgi:hypothetical protein